MTNNINGIGINTGSVNGYPTKPQKEEVKSEEKQDTQQPQAQHRALNPDDVLTFMAQQAAFKKPANLYAGKYDIAKYVTPEQAQRIAGFVTSFEGEVTKGLVTLNEEFGDNISEAAKYEIAAKMVV